MSHTDRKFNNPDDLGRAMSEVIKDPVLDQALKNFRLSVHAWSEAAYGSRQTIVMAAPHRRTWRLVATWTFGCVLAAGIAVGGLHERDHRLEMARIAAQRDAEQQRQVVEERAREAEDLLAKVDKDVSREVPNAMEPLAQLKAGDESR